MSTVENYEDLKKLIAIFEKEVIGNADCFSAVLSMIKNVPSLEGTREAHDVYYEIKHLFEKLCAENIKQIFDLILEKANTKLYQAKMSAKYSLTEIMNDDEKNTNQV